MFPLKTALIPAPNCLIIFHNPINAFLTGLITALTIFLNVSDFYRQPKATPIAAIAATAIPIGPINAVISPPIKGILVINPPILGRTPLIFAPNFVKKACPPSVAVNKVTASEMPTILCASIRLVPVKALLQHLNRQIL